MAHDDTRGNDTRIHSIPCELHKLDNSDATAAVRELYRAQGALRAVAGLACGARVGNDLDNVQREDLYLLLDMLSDHLQANARVVDQFVSDFGSSRFYAENPGLRAY